MFSILRKNCCWSDWRFSARGRTCLSCLHRPWRHTSLANTSPRAKRNCQFCDVGDRPGCRSGCLSNSTAAIEFKKSLNKINTEVPDYDVLLLDKPNRMVVAYDSADRRQCSDHHSIQSLESDIRKCVKGWNENPNPSMWTKTAKQVLESLKRLLQGTTGAGH